MNSISYPSTDHFRPETFEIELRTNCLMSVSPITGSIQTSEIPGARWMFRLSYGPVPLELQAEREAFFTELGGLANRVTLWHLSRPAPRGTMRGSPTLSASAAAGDSSLSITTTPGVTLLKGDMIKAGSQLFQVIADATTATSTLVAQVRPYVRAAINSASTVLWDKPTATFVMTTPGVSIPYTSARGESFLVEFAEAWA